MNISFIPLQKEHLKYFIMYESDKELTKYYSSHFNDDPEYIEQKFYRTLKAQKELELYEKIEGNGWLINKKSSTLQTWMVMSNTVIVGVIEVYLTTNPHVLSFGFLVFPQYQQRGIGKSIIQLLIKKLEDGTLFPKNKTFMSTFTEIESHVDVDNIASIKSMLRSNFKLFQGRVYAKNTVSNIYRYKLNKQPINQ